MTQFSIFRCIPLLFTLCIALAWSPNSANAQFDDVLSARLITGWRTSDGTHLSAFELKLAPGWKTYWRAPGDAGIPPLMDTTGSQNLKTARIIWPRPKVFYQNNLRSIGYAGTVVLPVALTPARKGGDITFTARLDIGVCEEICIPKTLNLTATLPGKSTRRSPKIAAALADQPFSAREAGVRNVTCRISPAEDGLELTTRFEMDSLRGKEAIAIEAGNPLLWVSEPDMTRSGSTVTATVDVAHVEGKPFSIRRSDITITVIGKGEAVEINGCARG